MQAGIAGSSRRPTGRSRREQAPIELSITPTLVDPLVDPGPVTFTSTSKFVTFGSTPGCTPVKPAAGGTSAIECASSPYPLTVTIDADQPAGRLPIDASDAGGRDVALADSDHDDLTVLAASDADLTLSKLTISEPLIAGGGGQLDADRRQCRRPAVAETEDRGRAAGRHHGHGRHRGRDLICNGAALVPAARDRRR